jgi:hypothetical protein
MKPEIEQTHMRMKNKPKTSVITVTCLQPNLIAWMLEPFSPDVSTLTDASSASSLIGTAVQTSNRSV